MFLLIHDINHGVGLFVREPFRHHPLSKIVLHDYDVSVDVLSVNEGPH